MADKYHFFYKAYPRRFQTNIDFLKAYERRWQTNITFFFAQPELFKPNLSQVWPNFDGVG
jgi:hypothetical protein